MSQLRSLTLWLLHHHKMAKGHQMLQLDGAGHVGTPAPSVSRVTGASAGFPTEGPCKCQQTKHSGLQRSCPPSYS